MTNSTNNPNEPSKLNDEALSEVSGGIVSIAITDLAKLLPEPTRQSVLNLNDHTENGERKFLTALQAELKINGHDHESELVSYYMQHHWEPIDSQYRAT